MRILIDRPRNIGVIFLVAILGFSNIVSVESVCSIGQAKIWPSTCNALARPNSEVCSTPMDKAAITSTIGTLFPERVRPHPSFFESIPVKLVLAKTGYVNVTFVHEGAFFRNALGLFVWDDVNKRIERTITLFPDVTFFNDRNHTDACLDVGDTVSAGPFAEGTILGFYVARDGFRGVTKPDILWYSWSDDSAPQLKPVDGEPHSAWASLSSLGMFLLGFEDQAKSALSDFDYNDVMFTFKADLVREPPPTDCFPPAPITSDVYALHNCYEWTFLRTESMQTYCKFPISLPSGYQLAPDDQLTRDAIRAFGDSKWTHHSQCLIIGNTTEVGVAVNSTTADACTSSTAAVRQKLSGKECYSSPCVHRILLRSIKPIQSCSVTGGKLCVPGQPTVISSRAPETRNPKEIWPFVANVDVQHSAAPINLPVEIPIDPEPPIDLLVVIDLARVNIASISALLNQISVRLPQSVGSQSVRVALAEIRPNQPTKITSLRGPSEYSSMIISESASTPDNLLLSKLRAVFLDSAIGWSVKAYRAAVVLSDNDFDASESLVRGLVEAQLWRGVVPVFISSKASSASTAKFTQLSQAIPVSASRVCASTDIAFDKFVQQAVPAIRLLARNIKFLTVVGDGERFGLIGSIVQPAAQPISQVFQWVTVNITIRWDNSFIPTSSNIPVTSVYTVPGWRANATTINLFVNRAPIARVSELEVSVPLHGGWSPFTLSVEDLDENTLVTWVSAPLRPDVFAIKPLQSGVPIVVGVNYTTLSFGVDPNPQTTFRGIVPLEFTISDGCLSTAVQVSVNITANRNLPPVSEDVFGSTLVNVPVKLLLKFWDPDVDSNVEAEIVNPSLGLGVFYRDADLTHPVATGDIFRFNFSAPVWYVPPTGQASKGNSPLGVLQYRAIDQFGDYSLPSHVRVVVRSQPVVLKSSFSTPEDVELIINIKSLDIVVDENDAGNTGINVKLESDVARGQLKVCSNDGDCNQDAASFIGSSLPSNGNLRFIPAKDEYGSNYASFRISYTDRYSSTIAATFTIDVIPVNDPPIISTQFPAEGIVIREGDVLPLNFRVIDVDSPPETLETLIKVQSRSRHGWKLLSCPSDQSCDPATLLLSSSDRSDQTATTPGDDVRKLCGDVFGKGIPVQDFSACYAEFYKLFSPAPDAYAYQFASIILTARDREGGVSTPVLIPIAVVPVNDAPTIEAPAVVEFNAGSLRDRIKSGDAVVNVADIDASPRSPERLTISLVEGAAGLLIIPSAALRKCTQSVQTGTISWECHDTISSFNKWLPELQFEFEASIDRSSRSHAVLNFTINDLGNTGDNFEPQLTASATSRLSYTPPPALVVEEGSTPVTAAAVAGAALGLLLLAGAGWFLRKKLTTQATDDYFAHDALNNAQANPLYTGNSVDMSNPAYKGPGDGL